MLKGAARLRVARGQKILDVDLNQDPPSQEDLLALLLGRSGKLRAPAIRVGDTVLIGYNAEMMKSLL